MRTACSGRRPLPRAAAIAALIGGLIVPGHAGGGPAIAQAPPPRPSADVLRIPFPQEDGTLTPYTFELGYSLMALVYDTLLWRDRNGVPQPLLARAVEVSPDAMRATIRLVDNARWHDGQPVTSGDVAFTFRHMVERPHPRFSPQLDAVARVDTPDPVTAVVTLRRPSPAFADQPLADVPILPAHLWKDLSRQRLAPDGPPVGSGPYRLVEHVSGQRYRFEANASYFRGPPAVRTLDVPIITSAEDTFRELERRRVDMLPVSLPEGGDDRLTGGGIATVRGVSYLGMALVLNTRTAPFDRVEVRRALAMAIDQARVSRAVGNVESADRGFLHPASAWAPEQSIEPFDEAGARRALSGLDVAPVTVLAEDNDPVKVTAARQVARAMVRAGMRAEARPLSTSEVSRALGLDGAPPSFTAAIAPIPPLVSYDPDFLRPLFASGAAGRLNVSGYSSPAFDQLAERVATTTDAPTRRAIVAESLRLLATDAPAIPLFFTRGTYVVRPFVYDGWVFVKGTGVFDKRSFVEPRVRPGIPGTQATPREDESDRDGLPLLAVAGGGAALLAALLALVALFRR